MQDNILGSLAYSDAGDDSFAQNSVTMDDTSVGLMQDDIVGSLAYQGAGVDGSGQDSMAQYSSFVPGSRMGGWPTGYYIDSPDGYGDAGANGTDGSASGTSANSTDSNSPWDGGIDFSSLGGGSYDLYEELGIPEPTNFDGDGTSLRDPNESAAVSAVNLANTNVTADPFLQDMYENRGIFDFNGTGTPNGESAAPNDQAAANEEVGSTGPIPGTVFSNFYDAVEKTAESVTPRDMLVSPYLSQARLEMPSILEGIGNVMAAWTASSSDDGQILQGKNVFTNGSVWGNDVKDIRFNSAATVIVGGSGLMEDGFEGFGNMVKSWFSSSDPTLVSSSVPDTTAANIQAVQDAGIPDYLSPKQDLHISPTDGRSPLTADPQDLLDGLQSGDFSILRKTRPNSVTVDFQNTIGEYWQNGQYVGDTQYGTVHFGQSGAHIVPANPNQW